MGANQVVYHISGIIDENEKLRTYPWDAQLVLIANMNILDSDLKIVDDLRRQ